MRRFAGLTLALALAACATAPPAPHATVDPPLPQLAGTRWVATSIGSDQLPPPERLILSFSDHEWRATAGCNSARAIYTITGNQLRLGAASTTERGCGDDLMAFEDRAFKILFGATIISSEVPGELTLGSPRGSIRLQRLP